MNGMDYREQFFTEGQKLIKNSLATLAVSYEYVILEGAGSPVEINLKERELVNMRCCRFSRCTGSLSSKY